MAGRITRQISTLVTILVTLHAMHTASAWQPPWNADKISPTNEIVMNASRALREAGGYNIIATSLAISAADILPPTPTTFFALNDEALMKVWLPPWLMMDLLHYHTSTHHLPWRRLVTLQPGTCVPTLLHTKNLVVTSSGNDSAPLSINGVRVSSPDIFTHRALVVHGVKQPFYPFRPGTTIGALNVTPCSDKNYPRGATVSASGSVSWLRVGNALRDNRFISFSVALRFAETDLIVGKMKNAKSNDTTVVGNEITVFAPADETFAYVAKSSPVVGVVVGCHIVPRRLLFSDLLKLPVGSKIPTLVPGRNLEITGAYDVFHPLYIDHVPVLHPDVFAADDFVIHGISRPFDLFNMTAAGN